MEMLGGHLANTVRRCRSNFCEEHWFFAHGARWHRVAKRRENEHTSILASWGDSLAMIRRRHPIVTAQLVEQLEGTSSDIIPLDSSGCEKAVGRSHGV